MIVTGTFMNEFNDWLSHPYWTRKFRYLLASCLIYCGDMIINILFQYFIINKMDILSKT